MSSVLALLYFCVKSCHYFLKIKEKRKTACSVKVMGPNQCIVGLMAALMAITRLVNSSFLSKFAVSVTVFVVTVVVVSVLIL